MNVAEVIPYKNHKEKFKIVFQELRKNRHVEVWDKYIYSAKKWEVKKWDRNAERVFLTLKKKVARC